MQTRGVSGFLGAAGSRSPDFPMPIPHEYWRQRIPAPSR